MPYTEPELIRAITRMAELYCASYPQDHESVQRFLDWVLLEWGYEHGKS